jgi:pilus assembly protein Flp/PilA
MKNLLTKVKNFIREEEGASAVEYGLLVALIAAVIIGSVTLLGNNLSTMFSNVAGSIGTGS